MMQSSLPDPASLAFGDIILVRFPFTNLQTTKQRPAVIVSGSAHNQARNDVVILAITGQTKVTSEYAHCEVADWQAAGLLKISVLKPIVATIEQEMIIRILGRLTAKDLSNLDLILAAIRYEPDDLSQKIC